MNKLIAVLVLAGALAQPLAGQTVGEKSLVITQRGMAPAAGGDLPARCEAESWVRMNPTKAYRAVVSGGYQAGICEAQEMARDLLRRDINRILGGEGVTSKAWQDQIDAYIDAAKTIETRIWIDRKLVEVTMQTTIDRKFFAVADR